MKKHIGFWLYSWTPVAIWMGTIFVLSSQHSVTVASSYWLNFAFFKFLHVVEYAVLFTLSYRAMARSYPRSSPFLWGFIAFALSVAYAATDEFHQSFTPSREPTVRDGIIDAFASGFVWIFLFIVLPKMPKRLKVLVKSLDIPC